MVLKKVLRNARDPRGKWVPNYEGPYLVKHAFSGGALLLTDAEGRDLKHPVNTDSKPPRPTEAEERFRKSSMGRTLLVLALG
ncbi:hypothetical protein CR513_57878, partial [Mucuna pruriens]